VSWEARIERVVDLATLRPMATQSPSLELKSAWKDGLDVVEARAPCERVPPYPWKEYDGDQ
jgi:hypothetical protein